MSAPPAIQDLYPGDFAHCFGCGRGNPHGHRLKSYVQGDETVARFTPGADQVAVPGFVYGGLIASLIDCHAMAAAAAETAAGGPIGEGPLPRFVTRALRVEYLAPTPLGHELRLRARVRERSERKTVVEVVLSAAGKETARGEVVAVRIPAAMERPPGG